MTKAKELSELASATTVTSGNVALSGGLGVTGVVTANGGAVFNEGSADVDFRIETNGQANMLFVDGGANAVGIGVNDPDATLDISGGSNKLGILRVTQRAAGAAAYGLDVGLDSSTGDPVFSRIVNDTATEALRITRSSGLVTAANGLTLTDGNLTVASGHGIDFSATGDGAGTDSSELLDDYEEGAWTPTYRQGSNNPAAYATQYGYYTKVGGVVHASGYLTVNGLASMSGTLVISGLPYTIQNLTSGFSSVNIGYYENLNLPTDNTSVMGYADANTVDLNLRIGNNTASSASMTAAQLSANGGMIFSVTYRSA